MGKFLQIRVSAWTYDEKAMQAAWPNLASLAWGQWSDSGSPYPGGKRGVLELTAALADGLAFADWPEAVKQQLSSEIRKTADLKTRLESALADWNPREAESLSNKLEDTLDDLEQLAPSA